MAKTRRWPLHKPNRAAAQSRDFARLPGKRRARALLSRIRVDEPKPLASHDEY